jgi:polyhydroxyalkanoate synthesis regulator phasin
MSLKIDEKDETSVNQVNRKLEAFVEIVMKKMIEQTSEIKKLKARVKELEKKG